MQYGIEVELTYDPILKTSIYLLNTGINRFHALGHYQATAPRTVTKLFAMWNGINLPADGSADDLAYVCQRLANLKK